MVVSKLFVTYCKYYRLLFKKFQKSAASVTVDIGEDRLVLQTRADVYYMDIYLPYTILQSECGAQFNKSNKVAYFHF